MSRLARYFLGSIALLVAAYSAWWWLSNMEQRPTATSRQTPAAAANPMLAAELFLEKQGIKTRTVDMQADGTAQLQSAGVMLLPYRSLRQNDKDTAAIWRWVENGGVLITSALQLDEDNEDPLLEPLAIERLTPVKTEGKVGSVQAPGSPRTLAFETHSADRVQQAENAPVPIWQDQSGEYLRAFAIGRGQIVVLGDPDWFSNNWLQHRDHAELLWRLVQLNGPSSQVLIVRSVNMPRWYVLFWQRAPLGWVVLPLLLALLFWRGVVRFGPLLPEPDLARRALLEHIDACGRWLWRTEGGPFRLLQAARIALRQRMAVRMPEWGRLPPQELAKRVARRFNLSADDVDRALNHPVSKSPHDFTARLRILQFLRKNL